MTGKKLGKEKVMPPLPNAKSNSEKQPANPEIALEPNAAHAARARNPNAVAAGPGNQLQENDTRPANQNSGEKELKPGAQPDGTASINEDRPRNEGIE